MSEDVCVCGHLDLAHDDDCAATPTLGACRMFGCGCLIFRSEDDREEAA